MWKPEDALLAITSYQGPPPQWFVVFGQEVHRFANVCARDNPEVLKVVETMKAKKKNKNAKISLLSYLLGRNQRIIVDRMKDLIVDAGSREFPQDDACEKKLGSRSEFAVFHNMRHPCQVRGPVQHRL